MYLNVCHYFSTPIQGVFVINSTQIIYSQIAILLNILVHCTKSGAYRLYFILMTFIWHVIWNAFLRSKTATYIFISFDRYMHVFIWIIIIFFKEQCPEIKDCLTKPSLMEGHQPLAQELVIRVILFAVF